MAVIQPSLFPMPVDPALPLGFLYCPEAITPEDERRLLDRIADLPSMQRRVQAASGFALPDLAQVLVTEYAPGAPIGWHKDRPFFGDVMGLCLASACNFRLRSLSVRESCSAFRCAWGPVPFISFGARRAGNWSTASRPLNRCDIQSPSETCAMVQEPRPSIPIGPTAGSGSLGNPPGLIPGSEPGLHSRKFTVRPARSRSCAAAPDFRRNARRWDQGFALCSFASALLTRKSQDAASYAKQTASNAIDLAKQKADELKKTAAETLDNSAQSVKAPLENLAGKTAYKETTRSTPGEAT
jgi:hypothetical protein